MDQADLVAACVDHRTPSTVWRGYSRRARRSEILSTVGASTTFIQYYLFGREAALGALMGDALSLSHSKPDSNCSVINPFRTPFWVSMPC